MNSWRPQLGCTALLIDGNDLVGEIVFEERFVVPVFKEILERSSLCRAAVRFLNDRTIRDLGCHRRFASAGWNGSGNQGWVAARPRRAAVHMIQGEAIDFFGGR